MSALITQADREAAARNTVLVEMRELILAGRADHHAEPWAAHRIAAERETVERIVKWLRGCEARGHEGSIALSIADAIEQGDWRND